MITLEEARAYFRYDPDTGKLFWKVDCGNHVHVGTECTAKNSDGYLTVGVDGITYSVARLIWFITYGEWPIDEIDHDDRDKINNRLSNLFDRTRSQNCANRAAWGQSGVKGIYHDKRCKTNPYRVQIKRDGVLVHNSWYPSFELAVQAQQDTYAKLGE